MRTKWRDCLLKAIKPTDQPKKIVRCHLAPAERHGRTCAQGGAGPGPGRCRRIWKGKKKPERGFKNLCCRLAPVSQNSASLKGKTSIVKAVKGSLSPSEVMHLKALRRGPLWFRLSPVRRWRSLLGSVPEQPRGCCAAFPNSAQRDPSPAFPKAAACGRGAAAVAAQRTVL